MTLAARGGVVCGVLLALAGGALAQETLYGRSPPPGSAYVRLVNSWRAPVVVATDFQPTARLGNTPADRVGAYAVAESVSGRILTVTADDGEQKGSLSFKATPDGFVTVVIKPDAGGRITLAAVSDQAEFNQNRARVSFYNAAPDCPVASLVLDAGGATVFHDVANAATKSRSVNPVTAMVRALCADRPGPSVMLEGLEIGRSYSVWLIGPAESASLFLTSDALAPYKPSNDN